MFKACPALRGFFSQNKGFVVAAEGLENRRPFAIGRFGIEREFLGALNVGQGVIKSMKASVRSRACQKGFRVRGNVANELFRDFVCPVVICNAADDQPAQRDQLGETWDGAVSV